MNLSYWEYKTWLSNIDFAIIGSGIVGLSCALELRQRYPKATILVLEKGILPQGASTKNAGFACFGSVSEIISDLEHHSKQEVVELVQKRCKGIQLLRDRLGDSAIDFQKHGGHELFMKKDGALFDKCSSRLDEINSLLRPVFNSPAFSHSKNSYRFYGIQDTYISNNHEAQIDTGKMMASLLDLVEKNDIKILNNVTLKQYAETNTGVQLKTDKFELAVTKMFIATNGFASSLLNENITPARAQILITKPIPNLHIKGTFHLEEGYYYFRNIDNRILLGGGRNLDFKAEETTDFGQTELVQNHLETLLKECILPDNEFEIDYRWSGIMGVGKQKKPIVKQVSNHVVCGVRLGGMGIAIGSLIGQEMANLA